MSALRDITIALAGHAARSGQFDRVNGHEPKHAPGKGLTCTAWFERFETIDSSGMNSTSVCVVMSVRIYTPLTTEGPAQDEIDPELMDATHALCGAYVGAFTLDGLVRCVDVRGGESGVRLAAAAGYVEIDRALHRIVTITVPLVVNDLWPESA